MSATTHVLREWPPSACDGGCGTSALADMFMVYDHVWSAAGLKTFDGFYCVPCLEQRLGRELTAADINSDVPLNHPGECDDTPRLAKLKADAAHRRGHWAWWQ
jgi:hypothetical protein